MCRSVRICFTACIHAELFGSYMPEACSNGRIFNHSALKCAIQGPFDMDVLRSVSLPMDQPLTVPVLLHLCVAAGAVKEQGARASAFTKPGQKVVASTQAAPAAAAHPKAAKGPAKKVGAKAAAKASKKPGPQPLASKVAQDGTYYDPEEAEPQQDYDSSKWQQEDGLQDAPITGVLQFSVAFSEGE
jgi:hypothetical protein